MKEEEEGGKRKKTNFKREVKRELETKKGGERGR